MARRHIVKTRVSSWTRRGFTSEEAYYLSEISKAGAKAPYIQAMIRRRLSLNANRVRYEWSANEYRRRIIEEYQKFGLPKYKGGNYRWYIDKYFYDYLTALKDKTPKDPEYESPRKKDYRRSRTKTGTSKPKAQTSKRKMLRMKINEYNDRINRAAMRGDQTLRHELERARNRYQTQLDNLR